MEPHEKVYRSKKKIMVDNFLGGISWAFGATIGIAIVLTIVGMIARNINFVPIVGNFVAEVLKFIMRNNRELFR